MSQVTIANISATLMKDYWHDFFLDELRSNLILKDLGMPGTVPEGQGVTVHWLSVADLSVHATAATDGTDPTAYNISGGDQTATLTPYNNAVNFTRGAAKTWIDGTMDQVMEKLARLAKYQVDRVIRDTILTAGGLAQYAGTAVARNSIAADSSFYADIDEFREAKATLSKADVEPHSNGMYVAVVHPDATYDIQGDSAWTDIAKYGGGGNERYFNGEIGDCYGIKFLQTTEALQMVNSGSASTDVFQSYIFGNQHFGVSDLVDVDIIVKDPAPASNVNGYSTVGYYMMFAAKELQPSAMIRLESGSTLTA